MDDTFFSKLVHCILISGKISLDTAIILIFEISYFSDAFFRQKDSK